MALALSWAVLKTGSFVEGGFFFSWLGIGREGRWEGGGTYGASPFRRGP